MNLHRSLIALLLVPLAALAACTSPQPSAAVTPGPTAAPAPAKAPPAAAELEVGYSALRISLPVLVAQSRGLFAAHGLAVKLKRYETAQPLVEEVLDGRIVAGGYAALPIVFTAAARSHAQLRLATAMIEDADHPISYLLKKHGATSITSVANLRHKRIGVLPTLAYQKWLLAVLTHAHVAPDEVTVIPLAPPQQVSGLAEGVVDALFTNDPMATSALASGVADSFGPRAPLVDVTGQPSWFGSFLLQPRFVEQQHAQAVALVAALDEAIAFIGRDQAAARQLFAPFAREAERPHVDRYPPASYLPSHQLDDARLNAELASEAELGILENKLTAPGWLVRAEPQTP